MSRCWYSVDLKMWKFGWFKKKEDIVIKNKKFYVNYLECHASKIMGDRNLKKNIQWQKLSTWQKIKKMKKICIECGEWCFSCI